MSSTAVKDETRAAIIKLRDKGFPSNEIAEMLCVGTSTVFITIAVYNAAQNSDLEALARQVKNKQTRAVKWACAVMGIDFVRVENYGKEPTPKEAPAPASAPNKEPATLDDVEASVMVAARLIEDSLSQLGQKIDQLVTLLQSCAAGNAKHIDTNADIIAQELRKQSDLLGGIKMNTKRKPFNGGN